MKIILLVVGKRHDATIVAAINDYTARLQRFATTEWVMVPAPHGHMSPEEQKGIESKKLLAQLKSDDTVVVLDERGTQWSSPEFANALTRWQHAAGRIVFIIGGAYGVTSELADRANAIWSLSSLVFPHQVVRLMLAEQLYRASTIIRGELYHH